MFVELRDMILSIFGETNMELTVLLNANRSANLLEIASFNEVGQDISLGLLF